MNDLSLLHQIWTNKITLKYWFIIMCSNSNRKRAIISNEFSANYIPRINWIENVFVFVHCGHQLVHTWIRIFHLRIHRYAKKGNKERFNQLHSKYIFQKCFHDFDGRATFWTWMESHFIREHFCIIFVSKNDVYTVFCFCLFLSCLFVSLSSFFLLNRYYSA